MRAIVPYLMILLMSVFLVGCAGAGGDLLAPPQGGSTLDTSGRTATNFDKQNAAKQTAKSVKYNGPLRVVTTLPPPAKTKGGNIQLIAQNDVVDVTFFGVEKLDRTVRVSPSGMISLPLVGEVKATDKTIRQFEKKLERIYGAKYLQSPQITVNMKESSGQRVTIDGEVKAPGIYPVSPTSTLLQVISQARGYTQIGDPTKVFVFRDVGGKRLAARYNLETIRAGQQQDPRIYGGDVVVTFSSAAKVAMNNLRTVLGLARSGAGLALMPF